MTLVQKWIVDCNMNGSTASQGDLADKTHADLLSWSWRVVGGVGNLGNHMVVDANDPTNIDCTDRGVTDGVFQRQALSQVAWACFTRANAADVDSLGCNNEANAAGGVWVNPLLLSNTGWSEDHPSLEFHPNVGPLVGGSRRSSVAGNTNQARVHVPDNGDVVAWDALNDDFAEHSNLEASGDVIHHVWADGTGSNATIRHATCDLSTGADCGVIADWTQEPNVVSANHAQFPEIAFDGNRLFVVYHYNSVTVGLPRVRVVLLTKCATDMNWASYPVDPPVAGRESWDQIIAIGNPVIALNRDENIVHIAFAEVQDAYLGEYNGFEDLTDGDLVWSWMGYETCP